MNPFKDILKLWNPRFRIGARSSVDTNRFGSEVYITIGDSEPIGPVCNDVVYHGADVISKLLTGDNAYKLAYIYIEYENTVGAPSPITGDRAVTAGDIHAMSSPQDILRASLVATPSLATSDPVKYVGNRSTYHAATSDTAGVIGALPFGEGSDSQVMAVSLVAAPGSVYTDDILYARYVLPVPKPVSGLGTVSVTWTTEVL